MQLPVILEQLLAVTVERGASDLHIRIGRKPILRIQGVLKNLEMEEIHAETLSEILKWLESEQPLAFHGRELLQQDTAIQHPVWGRFRVNIFYERNRPALAFRLVKRVIPTMEELHLPADLLRSLLDYPDGLVLVSGATGSGKSTTLAAMLQDMGARKSQHVITLEDPIEYLFNDALSVYTQREVNIDTESFSTGMRAALRQDPDVIMIGELRDIETFQTALRAAETGHLVISTTHAGNVTQTLERLVEFCSEDAVGLRRLSESLRGIFVQKLLEGMYGHRIPALEFFRMGSLGRNYILKRDLSRIQDLLEEDIEGGSFSFTEDLTRLVMEAKITKATAMSEAPNPKGLMMKLQGIQMGSRGGIH